VDGVLDLMGAERKRAFEIVLAGDVVKKKKPDPEIYSLAKERLVLDGRDCVVIEDSRNGLLAAVGAGMPCLITTSTYTRNEDFHEAAKVVPDLGDPPAVRVTLNDLKAIARQRAA
jgi:beta-phosphoglucomutase-like phosphatase (HAD superfamily)